MKIAMLFPGYSSQAVGMGKEFYDEFRIVQEYFEEASNCLNINFVKLCFASSDAELSKIHNSYPALFLINTSIAALLMQEGCHPSVVAGYCDGEIAAISAAGGINLPDGLYLLSKLSLFYEEFLKTGKFGALRIMGLSQDILEDFCVRSSVMNEMVFVALYYDTHDQIVAGNKDAIERLLGLIVSQYSVQFENVGIGIGLHSPLMTDVIKMFKMYLEKVDCRALKIEYINGLQGEVITDGTLLKQLIVQHFAQGLRYDKVIAKLADIDLIVEIGGKSALHQLIKKHFPEKKMIEMKRCADIKTLKTMIQ